MIYLFIVLIACVMYALYEYRNIQITYLNTQHFTDKKVDQSIKIAYISDIQYDHKFAPYPHKLLKRLITALNNEEADLLIIGGDMIHGKNKKNDIIFEALNNVMISNKIAVLGNHDYYDLDTVIESYKKHDITLLINEAIELDAFNFIGVDDLRMGKATLNIDLINPEKFNVLLTHEPDFFELLPQEIQIDMTLSGHLHGGQITFFGLYAPILPSKFKQKYRGGLVKKNHNVIYVSRGIGGYVFGLPIRFFAKPEIVIINI